MIQLPGKLSVRHIKGRKGIFAVGELSSDVGTFKVKDPILDQFEEGEYRGSFHVTRIYPDSYIYFGRVVTEVRASLAGFELEDEIKPVPAEVPSEPDPADRDANGAQAPAPAAMTSVPAADPQPAQASTEVAPGGADSQESDPDLALFGAELHQAVKDGGTVKLDPTIDRTVFRQQRDRLKATGYGFDATTQSWNRQQ